MDYVRRMVVEPKSNSLAHGATASRYVLKQLLRFDRLPRRSNGVSYNLELQTGLGIALNFVGIR